MRRDRIVASCLVALAAACSAAPPAPPPAVPAPVMTAEPVASAPPPPAPAPEPAKPESPFHEIATVSATQAQTADAPLDVGLYTLGSELFLGRGDYLRDRLFRVRDGAISRDEVMLPGGAKGSGMGRFHKLQGSWPDHAYLVNVALDGGGRYHNEWNLFRYEARAAPRSEAVWTPVFRHDDPNVMTVAMSPETAGPSWDGELALMSDGRVLGRFNDRLRVLDGPRSAVPTLTPAAECKGHARVAFGNWQESSRLLGLPSGHLVVAGNDCAGEGLALEWFAPGAARGTVVTFGKGCALRKVDGPRIDALTLWALCKDERDVLFGFDGHEIAEIAYPGSTIADMVVTAGGALHVADERVQHTLHIRAPGGGWRQIPLGDAGGDLAVLGEDDIWLFDGASLWRNKAPAGPPQAFAWPTDAAQVATSFRSPRAATRACESIYVLFFGFAKTTPDDYDFPRTRAALKGHTELAAAHLVVTREGGRKYFGAFVPTLELGKKLAATVRNGVKDAKPELLCAKPELIREIKMSFSTGEVDR
jgi:hypothetical protein